MTATGARVCPACQLVNPAFAARCDCGHAFDGAHEAFRALLESLPSRRTPWLRRQILKWADIVCFGIVLFLLGRLEVHPIALTVLFAALVLVLRTTARIPRLGEPSGLAILAKDRRPPVLLLSRALRGTWLEESIEPVTSKLGPFVAITGPGGPSIYMGARRIACDAARGEELFRAAVRAAAAVVVLAPDAADVAEDLKIVAAEGARDRLFIVVPGGGDLLPLREAARGVLDIPDTVDTDVAHAIRFGLEPAAIRCDGRRWRRGFRTQAADALLRAFARR